MIAWDELTDWPRATAQRDRDIRIARRHPEADPAHIVRGIVRRGLKPRTPRESISLRVDPEVLAWFRALGPGWQTRINTVLKAHQEALSRSDNGDRRPRGQRRRTPLGGR